VLAHRLVMNFRAETERLTPEALLHELIKEVGR